MSERPPYKLSKAIQNIEMDKHLKKIIKRYAERNSADRYKSVADIIKDLSRIPKSGFIIQKKSKHIVDIVQELKGAITETL